MRFPSDSLLHYWDFKPGTVAWGSPLYRYVETEEIAAVLYALKTLLRSPQERRVVTDMIDSLALPATFDPRPHRASHVQQSQQREALRRKYGPGGEGPEHRALKKYIFEHPEVLGLRPVYKQMEYPFDSGDRVDVYFRTVDGTIIVVEIEIEGQDATRVGTLQAIKYRALAAAEAGHRLLSEKTQALLVAYSIPLSVAAFAKQYEIQCHQIRPAH